VNTQLCMLCAFPGGALKKSATDSWVHTLCANWIPEVFVKDVGYGVHKVSLSHLDKKRYRLMCQMCSTKGACIQCSYGRCASAAHPWCVHHQNKAWTRRVVKTEDGEHIWEMFCKQHAACVSEPVKPRPKPPPRAEFAPAESDSYSPRGPYGGSSSSSSSGGGGFNRPKGKVKLNMAHALLKRQPLGGGGGGGVDRAGERSSVGGKSTGSSSTAGASSSSSSYPIYTMDEWPGQTEGEPLDLDHFWKVVSMGYAFCCTIVLPPFFPCLRCLSLSHSLLFIYCSLPAFSDMTWRV
jgi:hypothetical protein